LESFAKLFNQALEFLSNEVGVEPLIFNVDPFVVIENSVKFEIKLIQGGLTINPELEILGHFALRLNHVRDRCLHLG